MQECTEAIQSLTGCRTRCGQDIDCQCRGGKCGFDDAAEKCEEVEAMEQHVDLARDVMDQACSGTAKAPAIILVVGLLMAGLLAK